MSLTPHEIEIILKDLTTIVLIYCVGSAVLT